MTRSTRRRALAGVVLAGALALTGVVAPATAQAATPSPVQPAVAASAAEQAVFALLNRQRVQNGLPRLTRSALLVRAALGHNRRMSAAQTLSHQLPGEPSFSQRITDAGYTWRAAAENIGDTTQTSQAGAIAIQNAFYDEVPPNDGHRRNILSTAVTQVGISVLVDAHGVLWVTEDFAAPA